MFSEILRIRPQLDPASTARMESSLSARFLRVAKRFRAGLNFAIKGTIAGIGLGLLSRLLNPLERIEEKIKDLLGQGSDMEELADRFGTTPGRIKQIQDIAGMIGVTPDRLREIMGKFAESIEKAREEIADPNSEDSETTNVLREFANEKDLANAFFQFIQSLKNVGQGPGRDIISDTGTLKRLQHGGDPLSENERARLKERGLLTEQSGLDLRKEMEKAVFGEQLFGASRRLIDTNFPRFLKNLNQPSEETLNKAFDKLGQLNDQDRRQKVATETQDLLNLTGKLSPDIIKGLNDAEARKLERELNDFDRIKDLQSLKVGLDQLAEGMQLIQQLLGKIVVLLQNGVGYFLGLKNSPNFNRKPEGKN